MSASKFGNWNGVQKLTADLFKHSDAATKKSAAVFGLIAEKFAKDHIANQDLNWPPLSEKYAAQKARDGYSDFIMVRTSTYMQSITSWNEEYVGYAGVKRGVYYDTENGDTEEICNIAKLHEYGTDEAGKNRDITIPARPLWGPTLREAMEKWSAGHSPVHYFQKSVKESMT